MHPHHIYLIQCPDQKGILASVSGFFSERECNIIHCEQHTDTSSGEFFLRIKVDTSELKLSQKDMHDAFDSLSETYAFNWSFADSESKPRMAIMVTTASHCLYDLLLRHEEGELNCDIPLIISNRPVLEKVAERFQIPFYCMPVDPNNKAAQEKAVLELIAKHHIDLVVLARYMQILSDNFCAQLPERVINIHHAFLPSFQGARPYHRAFERGVKMIGATAHYVTKDLDEGPIIEQDVERVSHEQNAEELVQIGKDIERVVLSRAVKAHLEHRIIAKNGRTIIFSNGA